MNCISQFRHIGRKIICVGRNYKEHAIELNNPIPKKPLLFSKTSNSYLLEGEGKICFPFGCSKLHYEVELGVVIGKTAHKITKNDAMNFVAGYAIALDMTARDLQDELKRNGEPWFIAKSFDTSCPVGNFIEQSKIPNPYNIEIYCKLNEKIQQKSLTNLMIFNIPTLLEYISKYITLERGDFILTGTPAGVGDCKSGDKLEIGITNFSSSTFYIE